MKKIIILLAILFSNLLLAQNMLSLPQGYDVSNLSSYGNSAIRGDVANLGNLNPAAFGVFDEMSIATSFQYTGAINEAWITNIGINEKTNVPQSVTAIFPAKDFYVGIGFDSKYQCEWDIKKTLIVSKSDPDGENGYYYKPVHEISVNNLFVGVGYKLNNVWNDGDLYLGIKLNFHNFGYYSENATSLFEGESDEFGWEIGAIYSMKLNRENDFVLGVSYEKGAKTTLSAKGEFKKKLFSLEEAATIVPLEDRVEKGEIPANLKCDCSISPSDNFILLLNSTITFWNKTGLNAENQLSISCSGHIQIAKNMSISTGVYHTDLERELENPFPKPDFNATYLTAGISYTYKLIKANLCLADSHWFSDEWRKQTIVKTSFDISLDDLL